jgi:serine/threonine-protein kinase
MARSFSSATGTNATLNGAESQDVVLDALACPPNSAARPILKRTPPEVGIVRVGRYEFADCIAKGGMATVHFARLHGDFGFCRVVAVKRLLPQYASDEQFKAMFIEEARLAARIRHPNVVSTLDVVADRDEVLLVMDYVHGDALSSLSKHLRTRPQPIAPLNVTSAILSDVLRGLAFAHATTDKDGKPLNIVHCDVSPQNILVGVDGVARVLDFGIAKATNSLADSTQGVVRGKPGYIAPEQLKGAEATPRSDLFAVGVVLWEMLSGQRLFGGAGFRATLAQRYHSELQRPSAHNPNVNPALEAVVMKSLARDPAERYRDASEMMRALELACPPARPSAVAEWVEELAADTLVERGRLLSRLESEKRRSIPAPSAADDADWLPLDDVRTDGISTARSLRTVIEALPKRRLQRVFAALGVIAVTFGIGGFLSQTLGDEAPTELLATAPLPVVAPVTVSATALAKSERPAQPEPEVVRTATSTATGSEVKVAATAPSAGSTPPKPQAVRPGARGNKCSPPYTIDSVGRKHYRAECFR